MASKVELPFLFENAGWPVLLVEGGVIRKANQAAVQLFGSVLQSDSTSLASILSQSNDPSSEQVLSAWERSTAGNVQVKFRTPDGLEAVFNTYICSFARDEEKCFLLQLHRDTPAAATTSSAVPAEREPGTETIFFQRQKVDRATQLARSVALDFNNALTSVLGHCSWILSEMPPEHEWRKSMEDIEKATEKAAQKAHHLAAFNRSEQETAVSGNLNALVRRVVQDFRSGKGANIEWNLQLDEQLYPARCEKSKVHQALLKIVENAVEAAGGERGIIDVVTRNMEIRSPLQDGVVRVEPGCYVCLEISDSGPGIAPEVLPRVFEPFFTTKRGHRGLGLAWAYGAITNQGGRISVLSQVSKGTTARIYLPAQQRVVRGVSTDTEHLRGNETVLLVDDEDLVLSLGQAVLGALGYKVLAASGGEAALEILADREGKIDLAIVDWIMPHMSGKELVAEIRKQYPQLPILFTSGYVNLPGATEGEEFLQKPFTTQELLQRVREKLHLRDAA